METQTNTYIYGRHPVEELLKTSPKKISKIFVREGIRIADMNVIMSIASANKIPVVNVNKKKINDLVGTVNDQGIIAEASFVSYADFDTWLAGLDLTKNPAVFLLDEITDPHNVGAILRTAAAIGVSGVIIGKHNQASINGTVFKTSAGYASRVPIIRVSNLNTAVLDLKKAGFWSYGLALEGESLWSQKFNAPSVFIIGNEGEGIRAQTLKHCDFKISIPMTNSVESLNASVSSAIVGYEWLRQQK